MTTSGVQTFGNTTEIVDIFTEAFERCGIEAPDISAKHLESARRSMSFMFSQWANNGPNLWAVDQRRFTLTSGVSSFTLPTDTVSILQAIVSYDDGTTVTDTTLSPISRAEYAAIPVKATAGTAPTQFYLERTLTPVVYVYPVQNNSSRTFVYWRMRILQDPGSFFATPDAPNRWMEAIASGLSEHLAVKWAPERLGPPVNLPARALAAYEAAAAEDTESVPVRIFPDDTRVAY